MEGKETFAYKFMLSLFMEDINYFRAKHVKSWLRRIKYDRTVYDSQVHNLILKPLMEKGFITKGVDGYSVVPGSKVRLDDLKAKKPGPKPIEDATKVPEPPAMGVDVLDGLDVDNISTEEKDEWDTYIAKKLKSDTQEKP